MTGGLSQEQITAITEHAEAFGQYLIVGQYHRKDSEMSLYYEIVSEYWTKCHNLHCAEKEKGIDGLFFQMKLKDFIDKIKENGL